jgi:hypothetical protein
VTRLEFVVPGTPVSAQAQAAAKHLWKQRVRQVAQAVMAVGVLPTLDDVVLRIAYFYVDVPAAASTIS